MSHFAKVLDGKVVDCIVCDEDFFQKFVDNSPGEWVKTSYNIVGGVYYDPITGEPHPDQEAVISEDEGRQRKNFAGIGYSYDEILNAFIPPKPFESWILNEETANWEPPVKMPVDQDNTYTWNETTGQWDILSSQ